MTDYDQSEDSSNNNNWKVFRNTEAGVLLARLYGNKYESNHRVNSFTCRKRRQSKSDKQSTTRERWREVNAKYGCQDPSQCHFDRTKARSVKAPSFHKKLNTIDISAVDLIPKKKSQYLCNQENANNEELKIHFRPGNMPCFSTNEEKDRLNDIFTCKGGKSLPDELTMPIRKTSRELMRLKQETARIRKAKKLRSQKIVQDITNVNAVDNIEESSDFEDESTLKSTLFDQIVQEIKERREYQVEMEKYGSGENTRDTVVKEITARVSRLKQLDKSRALQIISSLSLRS